VSHLIRSNPRKTEIVEIIRSTNRQTDKQTDRQTNKQTINCLHVVDLRQNNDIRLLRDVYLCSNSSCSTAKKSITPILQSYVHVIISCITVMI
jgi:hypothetical protein